MKTVEQIIDRIVNNIETLEGRKADLEYLINIHQDDSDKIDSLNAVMRITKGELIANKYMKDWIEGLTRENNDLC
jgi:hypothetical protein